MERGVDQCIAISVFAIFYANYTSSQVLFLSYFFSVSLQRYIISPFGFFTIQASCSGN